MVFQMKSICTFHEKHLHFSWKAPVLLVKSGCFSLFRCFLCDFQVHFMCFSFDFHFSGVLFMCFSLFRCAFHVLYRCFSCAFHFSGMLFMCFSLFRCFSCAFHFLVAFHVLFRCFSWKVSLLIWKALPTLHVMCEKSKLRFRVITKYNMKD